MNNPRKKLHLAVAASALLVLAVLLVVVHHALREPIMQAAVHGEIAAVDRLTSIDPFLLDTTWPDSLSPDTLLSVAIVNRQRSVAMMLIRKGADVNARGSAGMMPLHRAAEWGDTDMIRALLDAGSTVDAPNGIMDTAAFLALFHGHEDAYHLLVERGASPASPVHVAASFDDLADLKSALASDPGGINTVQAHRNPLQHAVAHGHPAIVRYLLEQEAQADESTLELAKESGSPAIVGILRAYITRDL